ncbi:MAG TPA: 16S rRNA (cytosine(1402)-N(4))-methyltransferase RsmH [bacterium]|nr:16S rRNA (cytosine(1402)-N(4))-methyltransferase RsmH [bacterium]
MSTHVPVLVDEVMTYLAPREGAVIVDATVGDGGHAEAVLRRIAPAGRLIGLDRDGDAIAHAEERLRPFGRNVTLQQASFGDLDGALDALGVGTVDGILLDIGVSTRQLLEPSRGFSFDRAGPLDMRMDRGQDLTAADLVNTLRERDLADLIYRYGEERASRRIARQIVTRRPLRTTRDLVQAVEAALGGSRGRLHPATRTFQAIRIATNDEMGELEAGLPQAIRRLRPGGRLCVIAFHSLEDRIVKQTLARFSKGCTCPPDLPVCGCGGQRLLRVLTKKPVTASAAEVRQNPRARSARLRAAERLEDAAPAARSGRRPRGGETH